MSKAEGPCGTEPGRTHRWQTWYRGEPGAPFAGRYWWCEKCGKETTRNPR